MRHLPYRDVLRSQHETSKTGGSSAQPHPSPSNIGRSYLPMPYSGQHPPREPTLPTYILHRQSPSLSRKQLQPRPAQASPGQPSSHFKGRVANRSVDKGKLALRRRGRRQKTPRAVAKTAPSATAMPIPAFTPVVSPPGDIGELETTLVANGDSSLVKGTTLPGRGVAPLKAGAGVAAAYA